MKADFKQWLTLHKGKPLDSEMIKMISEHHEDETLNMLANDGLVLSCCGNSLSIGPNHAGKTDKNWAVYDYDQISPVKEYATLQKAINYANS